MNPNQAWRDTICLLAGNPVRRSSRPGEHFEPPVSHSRSRWLRTRKVFTLLSLFMAFAVAPARLL